MNRRDRPPPPEFFTAARPPAGPRRAGLRLGQIELVLSGLDDGLAEALLERYGPYSIREASSEDALRVELGLEPRDYFIDPPAKAEPNPVEIACDGARVRYVGHRVAGWFEVEGHAGQVLLARGDYEPAERAIENYIRAAVAWRAASRGGALVHAASAVHLGGGYLFFGPSGVGKSTLSRCNRRARVVSDDLSLVLPGPGGGLDLIGTPFRGTYEEGRPVAGRFPLRRGFRLVQAPHAAVHVVPRARVFGELVGNLPFLAEGFALRPDLFARVEQAFAGVPLAHLHFCKDESYWDAIERLDRVSSERGDRDG